MNRVPFVTAVMSFVVLHIGATIGTRANAGSTAQGTAMEQDTPAIEDTAASPQGSTHINVSSQLSGHWRAAETADEKKQRLQAVDEVTADMVRFKRSKARDRLKDRTSPPATIMIEVTDSTVAISSGDNRIELRLGGSPVEAEGSKGKSEISATLEGNRLVVFTHGDKGDRTVTYQTSGESLSMTVTMTVDALASPLTYVTTFARIE